MTFQDSLIVVIFVISILLATIAALLPKLKQYRLKLYRTKQKRRRVRSKKSTKRYIQIRIK